MPKLKTHSGAKKRFSLTKTGLVKVEGTFANGELVTEKPADDNGNDDDDDGNDSGGGGGSDGGSTGGSSGSSSIGWNGW